ncbi:MAG: tyrosine-protein phosphatase [Pseudomonadota bacterium]
MVMRCANWTPEERREHEARHQERVHKQEARAAASLSAAALLAFPQTLRENISRLERQSTLPDNLVAEAWKCLEDNTEYLEEKWTSISNEPRPPYISLENPADKHEREVVLNRFDDIRLVHASAIADPIRSRNAEQPHFLHANYVDMGCGRHFIAAQKPVAGEIPGFHQAIADHKVALVVDLTKYSEQDAATDYFPRQKGKSLQALGCQLMAYCKRRVKFKPLMMIDQEIELRGGQATHTVQRLHFPGWPDHGVISPKTLIGLADKIEATSPDPARPVVIHCMAGVGRTGTLMSFLAARKRIADEVARNRGVCNPAMVLRIALDAVAQGRLQRGPSFVQTPEQFNLLVAALMQSFAEPMKLAGKYGTSALPSVLPSVSPTAKPAFKAVVAGERRVRFDVPESTIEQVWARLCKLSASLAPEPANVTSNRADVICPERTGIKVRVGIGAEAKYAAIHANAIAFSGSMREVGSGNTPSAPVRIAIAGQSPQNFERCESFLLHGLLSKRGLLEFTSPTANADSSRSAENPIVSQLQQRWQAVGRTADGLILGQRFKVAAVEEMPRDADDYRRVKVTAVDLQNPGETVSMYITQAGMKFDDNVLRAEEIARADALTEGHLHAGRSDALAHITGGAADPTVVSYTGIGRNATLICYREAVARFASMQDEGGIDGLIEDIVAQGRRDRGPHFIHSALQLNELKQAVLARFREERFQSANVAAYA